ncbi:hypothetical protein [Halobacterium zhouii]|uniref:hypothetical protein n=1 Tax=Halobacterium zhouii TaxID=2902624 RepID=UPI001E5BFB93|nr:hypothetical protein [Halobacterium zhouii]
MDAPRQLQSAANEHDDVTITRRDYDDENVIVVDFGPDVHASVDVVGDTVIVVAGDQQYEFERPPEATDITTNDGMLEIRE